MAHRPLPRRGANAVEFGLTLPVFMAILLGLVDYGWLFAAQAGIDNATAIACREGSMIDERLGNPYNIANTELVTRAAPWCDLADSCIHDAADAGYPVPDKAIRCEVTMDFRPLIGFVPVPDQIDSISYYRMEWQR